jgi:hypothetical protein
MQIIAGDGSEPEPCVIVNAVNLNERPVTITSFSWRIGKGKKARYCMQNVAGRYSSKIPIVLAHGEEARFMISLPEAPAWPADMALFVDDLGESNLKTLRALLFTSVGQTVEVPVDTKVCKLIATADPATASEHAKRRGAPTRSNPAAPASADT